MHYHIPQHFTALLDPLLPSLPAIIDRVDLDSIIDQCTQLASDTSDNGIFTNIQILLSRITTLANHYEISEQMGNQFDSEFRHLISDIETCSGYLSYCAFSHHLFSIPYSQLGFKSFEQFICLSGAYIHNILNRDHNISTFSWDSHHGPFFIRNYFYRYRNNDFCFVQEDISPRSLKNIFGDVVEFFKPETSRLVAYHSVEATFFATLLRFSIEHKIVIKILENYESFLQQILGEEPREKLNIDGSAFDTYLIEYPINRFVDDAINSHSLPKEFDGYQSPVTDGEYLFYPACGVKFTKVDIEPLIIALHKSCLDHFGRTSIETLIGYFSEVKIKYFSLKNDHQDRVVNKIFDILSN